MYIEKGTNESMQYKYLMMTDTNSHAMIHMEAIGSMTSFIV